MTSSQGQVDIGSVILKETFGLTDEEISQLEAGEYELESEKSAKQES